MGNHWIPHSSPDPVHTNPRAPDRALWFLPLFSVCFSFQQKQKAAVLGLQAQMTNTEHWTSALLFAFNVLNVLAGRLKKQGLCARAVRISSPFPSISKVFNYRLISSKPIKQVKTLYNRFHEIRSRIGDTAPKCWGASPASQASENALEGGKERERCWKAAFVKASARKTTCLLLWEFLDPSLCFQDPGAQS